MRTKAQEMFLRIAGSVRPTFKRFWSTTGFTVAMSTALIMSTQRRFAGSTAESLGYLALECALGALASLCATIAWELRTGYGAVEALGQVEDQPAAAIPGAGRTNGQLIGNLIGLLAGVSAAVFSYCTIFNDVNTISMTRYAALVAFLSLAFFVIPHLRGCEGLKMRVVLLTTRAATSLLFSFVMYLGLISITFAAITLFNLGISSMIYPQTAIAVFGVMAPFLFMSGIPGPHEDLEEAPYPVVVRNLALYVVTPVLTAYSVVLYLYFAKILVTREWPVGLVSHLVLWFALISTAVLYFVWPLAKTNKWADTFSKVFVRAIIPLLVMMFMSMGIRVQAYGITENRYYVLVLGIWVFGSMLYLSISKKVRCAALPAALAIIALLAVYGPVSSFAVSKWSQNQRFEGILNKYGMVSGNTIVPASQPSSVTTEDRQELAAILQYFDRSHDYSEVKLLPGDYKSDRFKDTFGFDYPIGVDSPRAKMVYYSENRAVDISGYSVLFDLTRQYTDEKGVAALSQGDIGATYVPVSQALQVTLSNASGQGTNVEWEGSIAEYVDTLRSKYQLDRSEIIPAEELVFVEESARLRIKVVLTEISGSVDSLTDRLEIYNVGFYVLVSEK